MSKKEIIELLESIDQNINDGNLDDAQIDIAINLRSLYKDLVNGEAFKDECREGKLYEDTINLPNSFERIDGSFRNTPTGKTFTASLMDCRDNWDSTKLHMDYVDQQSKILVDVKTSTMTGKCFSKALIQLQAFKNKFPDYKTIYIYKGIKNRDTISYLKRLMNMGLLDDYHSRGVNMVKLESMMNGDTVNLEKFF